MKNFYKITLGNQLLQVQLGEDHYEHRHRWDTLRHCHAEYELHILLDGRCQLEVEEQSLALTKGHGVLIVPGEHHLPRTLGDNFYRFSLDFSVKSERLAVALRQAVPSSRVFLADPQMLQICRDILFEYAAGNPFKETLQQALLAQLTVLLFRQLSVVLPSEDNADNITEHQRISLIDNFFEKHYSESAGELVLAQRLNLSRRQLDRVLKKHYGLNYRQKLIRTRMSHAAWLLRIFDIPISQVAQKVGYASDSAFFQAFRQHFGMTPSQYRKQLTKKK